MPSPESRHNEKTSYLDQGVHTLLDPVFQTFSSKEAAPQEVANYTEAFIKSAPLFMKGKVALGSVVLTHMADEASPDDSGRQQVVDGLLGAAKGLALKGTLKGCEHFGLTPASSGVAMGILSRTSEVGLTAATYYDENGKFNPYKGMARTALVALNPASLTVDALTGAGSGFLWGRFERDTRARWSFNPAVVNSVTAGTMGISSGFGNEFYRQLDTDGKIDPYLLLQRTASQGFVDALAGGVGGLQARRAIRLGQADHPSAMLEARDTPFQRGEIVDGQQAKLRDGMFTPIKRIGDLTTETWVGKVTAPSGEIIPAIFRPHNGTEAFAKRMQSEIAGYGLRTLGFDNGIPVTVARSMQLDGMQRAGFIQEMRGTNLKNYMQQAIGTADGALYSRSRRHLIEDKALQSDYRNKWIHRMVLREWDNHAMNMGVDTLPNGQKQITNLDLGDCLPSAKSHLDLIPHPQMRIGWEPLNYWLYKDLAGTKLPMETTQDLSALHEKFHTPEGRQQMQAVGLTPMQVEGILGRTKWFVDHGTMPSQHENLFFPTVWPHMKGVARTILRRPEPQRDISI